MSGMSVSSRIAPLVLVILDGYGIAPPGPGNAVALANKPALERLMKECPSAALAAAGVEVGLFPHQDGNSEAGHINIGAGRVVKQDLVAVTESIRNGTFMKNSAFEAAAQRVMGGKGRLHLMGLLSNEQSAHANPEHIRALVKFFRSHRVAPVLLHLFTDGRDTHQYASVRFLKDLLLELDPAHERIATIAGRYWGMDRKKEWSRTERAYGAIASGEGLRSSSAEKAVTDAYARGESDEFIQPTVIMERRKPVGTVQEGDAVVFFNARSDRARQLAKAFVQTDFNELNPGAFVRGKVFKDLTFVALTDFGPDLGEILTAFPSPDLEDTLPMVLKEFRQLYIAETDKYAHMTFFFNGGYASPVAGEHRILVRSPKVKSYDAAPVMAAEEITAVVEQNIMNDVYDFIGINYANPDMVAHTGNLQATIKGIEAVDACIERLDRAIKKRGGILIVTADHGNAEEVIDAASGTPDTEHSENPVPFILCDRRARQASHYRLRAHGRLADVAPTILALLGIRKPEVMTGESLILKSSNQEIKKSRNQLFF